MTPGSPRAEGPGRGYRVPQPPAGGGPKPSGATAGGRAEAAAGRSCGHGPFLQAFTSPLAASGTQAIAKILRRRGAGASPLPKSAPPDRLSFVRRAARFFGPAGAARAAGAAVHRDLARANRGAGAAGGARQTVLCRPCRAPACHTSCCLAAAPSTAQCDQNCRKSTLQRQCWRIGHTFSPFENLAENLPISSDLRRRNGVQRVVRGSVKFRYGMDAKNKRDRGRLNVDYSVDHVVAFAAQVFGSCGGPRLLGGPHTTGMCSCAIGQAHGRTVVARSKSALNGKGGQYRQVTARYARPGIECVQYRLRHYSRV